MRAAYYPGKGQPIVIETLPDPECGPGDILIKVNRCGICGTDLSFTSGSGIWDYGAGQFGHEFAGEIVEIGREVEGYRKGEKLTLLPSLSCGSCPVCDASRGNPVFCNNAGTASKGFAEYARLPVRAAVKLPDTLSFADAALVEPMAISLYGVRHARIEPGDRVLVLGAGAIALYAIYWARRLGAGKIVCMSRSDRHRALALEMGADAFVPFGENEAAEAREMLGGPAEVIFECIGVDGMVGKAVSHAQFFGRIVSLGFCTAPDTMMSSLAAYKSVNVQYLVGYTMKEFHYIADQIDKGHADPKAVISNDIALDDLPAMMNTLRGPHRETKVHVHPFGV